MSYIETVHAEKLASAYSVPAESYRDGGDFVRKASRDVSWRTRTPSDGIIRVIPTETMEPYSWYLDLKAFKERSLSATGFDTSTFTVDRGHAWENEKWEVKLPLWSYRVKHPTAIDLLEYHSVRPAVPVGNLEDSMGFLTPDSDLEAWAALQYGRLAPGMSEFSLSAFFGELREGLPRLLPKLATGKALELKNVGSDYLNVEFGWKPLLDDLRTLANQLFAASNGLFRAQGAYHRSRKNTVPLYTERGAPPIPTGIGIGVGSYLSVNPGDEKLGRGFFTDSRTVANSSITRRIAKVRSVEGEFVFLPKAGFDPSKYMDRLETLMSVEITPATLWQLAPWSWLVDWAADVGSALSSMEAAMSNRVLSTYYYGMEKTTAVVDVELSNITALSGGWGYYGPDSYRNTHIYNRKRRVRANPFGFQGSSSTTLTGDRMAILGALGLTRLK